MPKSHRQSVLLDTSFLITLYDTTRDNHENAKKYFKYFIASSIDMYISSIVASEYQQKGDINVIFNTNSFIDCPFNRGDGVIAGDFQKILSGRNPNDSRNAVKDDVKLLAQCANYEFDFIITDDASTLAKYCKRLYELGKIPTKSITMNEFDLSIFRDGQTSLLDSIED